MSTIETSPPPTSQAPLTPDSQGAEPTPRQQRKARRIARNVAFALLATIFILAFAGSWISRGVMAAALLAGVVI